MAMRGELDELVSAAVERRALYKIRRRPAAEARAIVDAIAGQERGEYSPPSLRGGSGSTAVSRR